MTHLRLSLVLLLQLLCAASSSAQTKPIPIELKRTDLARSLKELEGICLQPHFDEALTQTAISSSSFHYVAEPRFVSKQWIQRRWRAPEAQVTLTIPVEPALLGFALPQCEVLMVGGAPVSSAARLAAIVPIVARYGGRSPVVHSDSFDTEWHIKGGGGSVVQVRLLDPKSPNSDSLSYIVSVISPEGRGALRKAS